MYSNPQMGLCSMSFAVILIVVVGSSVLNTAQSHGNSRIETRHMKTLPGMSWDDMILFQNCS